MNQKEIRWKQRFGNFEKAWQALERAVRIENPSEVERGGIIQFYETAFELAWKTMKDYNEAQGFITKSPREAIKQAFQTDVISDGHVWLEALDDRNQTTHIYDEKIALEIVAKIRTRYFGMLTDLYRYLKHVID